MRDYVKRKFMDFPRLIVQLSHFSSCEATVKAVWVVTHNNIVILEASRVGEYTWSKNFRTLKNDGKENEN